MCCRHAVSTGVALYPAITSAHHNKVAVVTPGVNLVTDTARCDSNSYSCTSNNTAIARKPVLKNDLTQASPTQCVKKSFMMILFVVDASGIVGSVLLM
jgi:hypothetical protein